MATLATVTALSALVSELNDELKIDKKNKLWSLPAKERALNNAYFQVQKDMQFKIRECQEQFDIATQGGVREYDLASDFIHVDVVLYNNEEIHETEKTELAVEQRFANNVQGLPNEYYLWGLQIGFDPIPSSAGVCSIYGARKLPKMVTPSQGCVLPEDYNLAIVKYAAYLIWSGPRGNRQTAQEKATDYKQEMNTLKTAYLLRRTRGLRWRPKRRKRYSSPRSL